MKELHLDPHYLIESSYDSKNDGDFLIGILKKHALENNVRKYNCRVFSKESDGIDYYNNNSLHLKECLFVQTTRNYLEKCKVSDFFKNRVNIEWMTEKIKHDYYVLFSSI